MYLHLFLSIKGKICSWTWDSEDSIFSVSVLRYVQTKFPKFNRLWKLTFFHFQESEWFFSNWIDKMREHGNLHKKWSNLLITKIFGFRSFWFSKPDIIYFQSRFDATDFYRTSSCSFLNTNKWKIWEIYVILSIPCDSHQTVVIQYQYYMY